MKYTMITLLLLVAAASVARAQGHPCDLTADEVCTANGAGRFCHPCDTSAYFVCSHDGSGVMQRCGSGLHWCPSTNKCVPGNQLHTGCVPNVAVTVPKRLTDALSSDSLALPLTLDNVRTAAETALLQPAQSLVGSVLGAMQRAGGQFNQLIDAAVEAIEAGLPSAPIPLPFTAGASIGPAGGAVATTISSSAGGGLSFSSASSSGGIVGMATSTTTGAAASGEPVIVSRQISLSQPQGASQPVLVEQVTVSDGTVGGTKTTTVTRPASGSMPTGSAAATAAVQAGLELQQADAMENIAMELLAEGEAQALAAAQAFAAADAAAATGGSSAVSEALSEAGALADEAERLRDAAEQLLDAADAQVADATARLATTQGPTLSAFLSNGAVRAAGAADAGVLVPEGFVSEAAAAIMEAHMEALTQLSSSELDVVVPGSIDIDSGAAAAPTSSSSAAAAAAAAAAASLVGAGGIPVPLGGFTEFLDIPLPVPRSADIISPFDFDSMMDYDPEGSSAVGNSVAASKGISSGTGSVAPEHTMGARKEPLLVRNAGSNVGAAGGQRQQKQQQRLLTPQEMAVKRGMAGKGGLVLPGGGASEPAIAAF